MPLYDYTCLNGHVSEHYLRGGERHALTITCACGETAGPLWSPGAGRMLWAEEGRPRVIHHLGDEPVVVTSHADQRRRMHAAGVEFAGCRRGTPGAWL